MNRSTKVPYSLQAQQGMLSLRIYSLISGNGGHLHFSVFFSLHFGLGGGHTGLGGGHTGLGGGHFGLGGVQDESDVFLGAGTAAGADVGT